MGVLEEVLAEEYERSLSRSRSRSVRAAKSNGRSTRCRPMSSQADELA